MIELLCLLYRLLANGRQYSIMDVLRWWTRKVLKVKFAVEIKKNRQCDGFS